MPKVHAPDRLGTGFFLGLVSRLEPADHAKAHRVLTFAAGELARFDLNTINPGGLRWLALFPGGWAYVALWIDEGKLKPQTLGAGFLNALAFQPDWDANPWQAALRSSSPWAADLSFVEPRAQKVLGWLGDVRKFAPAEVGFDWLMKLVARTEPLYHDFAVETMIRSFAPADFAPIQAESPPAAAGGLGAAPPTVDLSKASFLFTGKLSTMTRDEAEVK